MARGREPPAGDPAYPPRRERAPPGPPLTTLAQLRSAGCWWWLVCRNPECGWSRPEADIVHAHICCLGVESSKSYAV
jgi:hypothetical protein